MILNVHVIQHQMISTTSVITAHPEERLGLLLVLLLDLLLRYCGNHTIDVYTITRDERKKINGGQIMKKITLRISSTDKGRLISTLVHVSSFQKVFIMSL